MTLTKNKMIREIGWRTRLKNRDVQLTLETLIEIWTEELVSGGRIELENFIVLETQTIDRGEQRGKINIEGTKYNAPRYIQRLTLRASKSLKARLRLKQEGRVRGDAQLRYPYRRTVVTPKPGHETKDEP